MAIPAYMTIIGATQNHITAGASSEKSVGTTRQGDRLDEIMVQSFKHDVIIATDPQSGQSTGKRLNHPVVISKVFDKTSPLLQEALSSGERLWVEIKWYRDSPIGQEHYFTTTLEEAIVLTVKDYMLDCQDPVHSHSTHMQEVHLGFRKITWTHEACGTSSVYNWDAPKTA
ncbi:Hcp family type VI secretion system effector [Pseudomonas sp. N3-W]|uniref:Hcp family type VI secretion system effector n=1 Tax=Pseudomonas fungipugnans TaxID=3024217 RepID=A0ABT6QW01_9PSED|nr:MULTISPECIES: Hcp family type VI secretion system effector [unclassified Pseudomonas]MDI2595088.1 Hcp family type VI secretion system effector [Pseudomonas sp. 681]UWF51374.1 Hcp family type VI secretion system effector [Pseudomonas sp. N3-W]